MSGTSESDPGLCRYRVRRESFLLDVELALPARGITGVFGRSGAGKTTLLRCIAGLEPDATGYLRVGDDVWDDSERRIRRAPHQRRAACVFQDGRLFSHLSVAGNLRFGLKRNRAAGGPDWRDVVELLDLAPLLERGTRELSGGEQQRVAIGRALLQSPRLVLLDEPLASLDARHKQQILPFLERLHARLSLPMLYVSHSLEELIAVCDHLIVMEKGRVVAVGELAALLARVDVPGLHGDETGALVSAAIAGYDEAYDLTRLAFPGGELTVPGRHPPERSEVRARILARDVSISLARPDASSILNVLPAVVREIGRHSGPFVTVRVAAGHTDLLARITRRSLDELRLRPGQRVFAQVKAVAVKSFGLRGV